MPREVIVKMRAGLALIFILGSVSASPAGGDAKTCSLMYDAMSATYKYCPEKGPARESTKFFAECMKTDYKINVRYLDEWRKMAQECRAQSDTKASNCEGYVSRMTSLAQEATKNNCAFMKSGGNWDAPPSYYQKTCQASASTSYNKNEGTFRRLLAECKAGAGNGTGNGGGDTGNGGGDTGNGGGTVTVNSGVTMYDTYKQPNSDLCYLEAGDKLSVLSSGKAKAPWRHLKGQSGDCKGKSGYVYDKGELN